MDFWKNQTETEFKEKTFIRRPKIEVNNNKNKTLCASAANGSADLREQQPRFVCRDLFLWVLTICSCRTYTRRPLLESGIVQIPRLAHSSGGSDGGVSSESRGRLQRVCGRTDMNSPGAWWNFLWLHITTCLLFVLFVCALCRFRRQGGREQYGYSEVMCRRCALFPSAGRVCSAFSPVPSCQQVVLKGAGKKLSLLGVSWCNCEEKKTPVGSSSNGMKRAS